jgi:hypothetical protein
VSAVVFRRLLEVPPARAVVTVLALPIAAANSEWCAMLLALRGSPVDAW